jgi:hypothetical protein
MVSHALVDQKALEIARSTSPWWDSRAPAEQTGDIVIVRTVAAPKDKPK